MAVTEKNEIHFKAYLTFEEPTEMGQIVQNTFDFFFLRLFYFFFLCYIWMYLSALNTSKKWRATRIYEYESTNDGIHTYTKYKQVIHWHIVNWMGPIVYINMWMCSRILYFWKHYSFIRGHKRSVRCCCSYSCCCYYCCCCLVLSALIRLFQVVTRIIVCVKKNLRFDWDAQ